MKRAAQLPYRHRAGLGALSWQDVQNMLDQQMPLSIEEALASYQAGNYADAVAKCQSANTWLKANVDSSMHTLGWDVPNVVRTFADSMSSATGQTDAQTDIGILLQLYPLYQQQISIGSGGLTTSNGPGGLFPVVSTTATILAFMLSSPNNWGFLLTMMGIGALKAFQLAVGFAGVSVPQSGTYDDATYNTLTAIVGRMGGNPSLLPTPEQLAASFQAAIQQAQSGVTPQPAQPAPAPPPAPPTAPTPAPAPSSQSNATPYVVGGVLVVTVIGIGTAVYFANRKKRRTLAAAA